MKILLCGLCGHMGREVTALTEAGFRGIETAAGVDPFADGSETIPCARSFAEACPDVDCVLDFSHHSLTKELTDFAVLNSLPLVIATTGQTEEEKGYIKKASEKIPVFFAANYSVGVALLIELAKKTAAVFPEAEIEIIEKHHDRKIDAPSGTALAIASALTEVRENAFNVCGRSGHGKRTPEEIGIHAVRMGNIAGVHEVIVGTPNQTITLKHEAHSRTLFAEGALAAVEFIAGKAPGMYDMRSMLKMNGSEE